MAAGAVIPFALGARTSLLGNSAGGHTEVLGSGGLAMIRLGGLRPCLEDRDVGLRRAWGVIVELNSRRRAKLTV